MAKDRLEREGLLSRELHALRRMGGTKVWKFGLLVVVLRCARYAV